nr:hypothetical protein BaRGS_024525 [Batillaria attramentaria]
MGSQTPTKTVTISSQGIVSPGKAVIATLPGSPTKKLGQLKTQAQIAPAGQGPMTLQLPISVSGTSMQQVQVPGSKFHYVRLVSPSTQQAVTVTKPAGTSTVTKVIPATRQIAPASATSNQVKITLPVGQNVQLQSGKTGTPVGGQTVQRIILPAAPTSVPVHPAPSLSVAAPTSLAPIRPNLQSAATSLTKLPPGTTLLTPSNLPGLQGFALVPAQYVTQLQNLNKQQVTVTQAASAAPVQQTTQQQQQQQTSQQQKSDYVPIASNDPAVTNYTIQRNSVNGTMLEATGARPRKPCNCTKSQCLKLYCDCFANGEFCHNCNCTNCANNLEHEEERSRAIKSCLDRNPMAFHPKIGKGKDSDGNRRHNKGCNCKRQRKLSV